MGFRAVLFDFGRTLFHPPDGAALLREAGLGPERAEELWTEIWRRAMTAEELARGRDLDPDAHRLNWTRLFALADPEAPGVSARLYEQSLPENWTPYPDTRPVLEELRRLGVPVGVISNVPTPLGPVLERHGLASLVSSLTHSYELRIEKPDPRIFREACVRLGRSPGETLMVGDSHHADGAAVLAGLTTLLLPDGDAGRPRGLDAALRLVRP